MWLPKWLRNKPQINHSGSRHSQLLSFLKSRLSSPSAATSILYDIKDFDKLKPEEQHVEILRVYLLFEHYCTDVDPILKTPVETFKEQLIEIFPWAKEHEYLRIAFQEPQEAKALMVTLFFREIVYPVLEITGNKSFNFYHNLYDWLEQLWQGSFKVFRLPENEKTVNPLVLEDLKILSRYVFKEFSNTFGTLNAEKLYNKAFTKISHLLRDHSNYNVVIDIMPHQLLTLDHLRILGRSQIQRIMLEQIEELRDLNAHLTHENEEKSQLYNRIKKREVNLSKIFENAFDAVVCTNEKGIVVAWNRKAIELFHYTPYEAIGKTLDELIIPTNHKEQHIKGMQRFITTKRSKVLNKIIEIEARRKDNSVFPIELCITDVSDGADFMLCGFIRDISERKQSEEKLIRARETAEENSKFQAQFMAKISHEIRTPLNAIIGFSEILSKSDLDKESEEYINLIHSSGESLMRLLNDILEFSRIEQGKVALHEESRDFSQTIHMMLAPYKEMARQKNIEFQVLFEEAFPQFIKTDYHRLSQVLLNLSSNALKFTKEGKIRIRFGYEFEENGKFLIQIRVSDTGKGISSDKLDLIFEPFKQEDGKVSSSYGGTGLGLSITRELVKAMGGSIKAFSPGTILPDRGVDFVFYIYAQLSESEDYDKAEISTERLFDGERTRQILVIEDNIINQKLLERVLSEENLEITICSTAEDGIELLKNKSFDLIFMDIQLPGMNGIEAAQYIKTELNLTTPIIALSANVSQEDMEISRKAGMQAHVGKPFRQAEIRAVIQTYVPSSAR